MCQIAVLMCVVSLGASGIEARVDSLVAAGRIDRAEVLLSELVEADDTADARWELERLRTRVDKIRKRFADHDEIIIETVSGVIAPKFMVSAGVIRRRIRSEKLW